MAVTSGYPSRSAPNGGAGASPAKTLACRKPRSRRLSPAETGRGPTRAVLCAPRDVRICRGSSAASLRRLSALSIRSQLPMNGRRPKILSAQSSVSHLILRSMSPSESLVDQRDEDESPRLAPPGPRGRLSRRRIAAGLTSLLALGLVLAYSLWWTKPSTFTDVGNGFSMKQTVSDLHPVTFDMVQRSIDEDPEIITLTGVRARVGTNSAGALITFAVCQREGTPFMSADGTAARSCETVADVEGQDVRLTPAATTTITMTVTPRRAGRVVIRGMDVDYTRGANHLWQRGTQATGPVVKVSVRD